MTETQKSVLACAIGTSLGLLIMLIVAPELLWFGMLAGFAGGYVSYEFKLVRQAIPVAWKAVGGISLEVAKEAKVFLSQKHPFLYPALMLAAWPTVKSVGGMINWNEVTTNPRDIIMTVIVVPSMYFVYSYIFTHCLALMAYVGCTYGEKSFWYPFFNRSEYLSDERRISQNEEEGLSQAPATYRNVALWVVKGVPLCLYGIVWKLPVMLLKLGWQGLGLLRRFLVHLAKLIHSKKRVACGTYCAIGVALSYMWLTPLGNPVVLIVGGGLIGAALGLVSAKLTSKWRISVAEA